MRDNTARLMGGGGGIKVGLKVHHFFFFFNPTCRVVSPPNGVLLMGFNDRALS